MLIEKKILRKYFPDFYWIDPTGDAQVEGTLRTNDGCEYRIRLYIPPDYPNSEPDMVIIDPSPLLDYDGNDVTEFENRYHLHLNQPRDGWPTICYTKEWTPETTLYKVLLKGRLWVEAFEAHLNTGRKLDRYLHHIEDDSDNEHNESSDEEDYEDSEDYGNDEYYDDES